MGTTLTGQTQSSTYDALLKVTDNGPIGATAKVITDGLGNDSVFKLGTASAEFTGALTLINTGLLVYDTNASHTLSLKPGSDLTANRVLTLTTGDADRTLALTGNPSLSGVTITGTGTLATGTSTLTLNGNATLNDWFDQSVKTTASPSFVQVTSTVATGTAPFVVSSTTAVSNLNASLLLGATWASPAAIGSTTPAAGSFTTLSASGNITLTGNPGVISFTGASFGQVSATTGDMYVSAPSGKKSILQVDVTNIVEASSTGLVVTGALSSTTGFYTSGNGGIVTGANRLGIDNNSGAARFYSYGANGTTEGTFEFHTIASDGAPDTTVATITNTGLSVTGTVSTTDPAGGAGPAWKLGVAAVVSPTSPNRTIRIDIAGTSYYLAAKTTND